MNLACAAQVIIIVLGLEGFQSVSVFHLSRSLVHTKVTPLRSQRLAVKK